MKIHSLIFIGLTTSIGTSLYASQILSLDKACAQGSNMQFIQCFDFGKSDQLINKYIQEHDLAAEVNTVRKEAVRSALQGLDFLNNWDDAQLFEYILWRYCPESKSILNEGSIDFKLEQLCEKLVQDPPGVKNTTCLGSTPLGGLRMQVSSTVRLYGILKFIGQFTNDKNQFDGAIRTVQQIRNKITGPLISANECLFLMNMNKNFPGVNNFVRPTSCFFDEASDFMRSVFRPEPNQEIPWKQSRLRVGQALARMDNKGSQIELIKMLLNAHYHPPQDIEELTNSLRTEKIFGDMSYRFMQELRQLTFEIMKNAPRKRQDRSLNKILLEAVRTCNTQKVGQLFADVIVPEVDAQDYSSGTEALMYAAAGGNMAIVEQLIIEGARVNAHNHKGWTPLMYASFNGHTEIVQKLVAAGADINAKEYSGVLDVKNYVKKTAYDLAKDRDAYEKAVAAGLKQRQEAIISADEEKKAT